jgi:hypothetical protein
MNQLAYRSIAVRRQDHAGLLAVRQHGSRSARASTTNAARAGRVTLSVPHPLASVRLQCALRFIARFAEAAVAVCEQRGNAMPPLSRGSRYSHDEQ